MATSTIKKKKIVFVCNSCGSEDVLVDAWAEWNKAIQRWELANTFDAAYCAKCEGECTAVPKTSR